MHKILFKEKKRQRPSTSIFVAILFLAFHYYLITYINSTYLQTYFSDGFIGILYSIGSIFSIFIFLKMPAICKKVGNYKIIVFFSLLEIVNMFSLGVFGNIKLITGIFFFIHHAINPLLLLNLDIFLEESSKTKEIGKSRGILLTVVGVASIISPFLVSSLIVKKTDNLNIVYIISMVFMILFFIMIKKYFKNMPTGEFKEIKIKRELKEFFSSRDISLSGITNFILQCLYAILIIYIPLYLREFGGFSWSEIGLITTISLMPFLLFEIPLGKLIDDDFGEKEILIIGFTIITLSIFLLNTIEKENIVGFIISLFCVRLGASFVEISSESHFFKKTKGKDELIGIFRMMGPFAFIITPLLASTIIESSGWQIFLPVFGVIMLSGIPCSLFLKDTK